MKVLFATWSMQGHYNPLVPLGWALRAAGHEVVVACHPSFAPTVTQAGLPALPAGPEVDVLEVLKGRLSKRSWEPKAPEAPEAAPNARRRLLGLRIGVDSADAMADDVLAFARSWRPDLVVFEPNAFVGPLVATLLGIPSVRLLWTVDFTARLGELEAELVEPMASRFGLTTIGALGTVTLDPCPPRLQVVDDLPRHPFRYVPYNGPAVLPDWLREPPSRPRVCVTWGTSLDGLGLDHMVLAPRVVEALADLDVETVVAVTDRQCDLFPDPPANVRHIGPVPLQPLLATCDAVVQQGGGGTTMTALAAGVPQLVVPHMPDQIFNARHLEATGASRTLTADEATVDGLRDAVHALLTDPGHRDAAARLRAESDARPTPAQTVALLERLARDGSLPEPSPNPSR